MRKSMYVTAMLCMVLSAGCTKYWYQPGKTIDQCQADHNYCLEELKKYSSNWQKMGDYEMDFLEDCMKNKGYTPYKEDELPLKVKRTDPDRTLSWRLKGIAGSLD